MSGSWLCPRGCLRRSKEGGSPPASHPCPTQQECGAFAPLWSISSPLCSVHKLQTDNVGAAEAARCTGVRSCCLLLTFSAPFHPGCCPAMSNTGEAKGSHHFCATPRAVLSLMSGCDPHFSGYVWGLYPSRLSLPHPKLLSRYCFATPIIPVTLKVPWSSCRHLVPIHNNPNAAVSNLQPVEQYLPEGKIWL